jgi:hypothetical protein
LRAAAEAGVLHPVVTGQLAKRLALVASVRDHHKNTVYSPPGAKGLPQVPRELGMEMLLKARSSA